MWREGGLLHLFPLRISTLCLSICAFCFVFHLYSNVCPAKHISSNTSGTMSKVNACVKSLFISPILDSNWWSDIIIKHRQQIPQA
jgi:hypothetical protein